MNREDVAMDVTVQNVEILRERLEKTERALAGMLFAFDDGVGQEWSADLLNFARQLVKAKEFLASQQGEQCVSDTGSCGVGGYCADCPSTHPEQAEGAQGERSGWGSLPIVQVPWNVFDRAVMWVEDRRRYGDDGTIVDDWKALKAIQRAALAQPSPAPELVRDRETPEAVAFIHERTGAVASADMVRVMEEGSVASGYTIALMAVSQHDRMTVERWQYFRRKMQQMRDLMRGMRDRLTTAQARVAELERELEEEEGSHLETIKQRDYAERWADELAKAIAEHLDVDIGEHSNLNNPWNEALVSMQQPVAQAGQVPDGVPDLCRFLAKLYCELDGLRYSTAKLPPEEIVDALIGKWPVLQGTRNQLNIKRISEQPYDESKLHAAIAAMLAAAPAQGE